MVHTFGFGLAICTGACILVYARHAVTGTLHYRLQCLNGMTPQRHEGSLLEGNWNSLLLLHDRE